MKVLRRLTVVVLIVLTSGLAKAGGEKFQITLLLSPSAEWVYFRNSANAGLYNDIFGTKLSYNFGIEYKRFFDPSLSFSTGFLYQNKGFRNTYTQENLDGTIEEGTTLGSAHFATLPLYLNAHHGITRKTEMIYTAGLGIGYLMSQTVRNVNYTGEDNAQDGLFDTGNGRSNINFFRDFYLGLHAGVGISTYIRSRIVLVLQPMYKYQLNDGRNPELPINDLFAAKLNSFAVDIKVGYFFTKQVRNRKKEL